MSRRGGVSAVPAARAPRPRRRAPRPLSIVAFPFVLTVYNFRSSQAHAREIETSVRKPKRGSALLHCARGASTIASPGRCRHLLSPPQSVRHDRTSMNILIMSR